MLGQKNYCKLKIGLSSNYKTNKLLEANLNGLVLNLLETFNNKLASEQIPEKLKISNIKLSSKKDALMRISIRQDTTRPDKHNIGRKSSNGTNNLQETF